MSPSYFVRRTMVSSHRRRNTLTFKHNVLRARIILGLVTFFLLLTGLYGVIKQIVQ